MFNFLRENLFMFSLVNRSYLKPFKYKYSKDLDRVLKFTMGYNDNKFRFIDPYNVSLGVLRLHIKKYPTEFMCLPKLNMRPSRRTIYESMIKLTADTMIIRDYDNPLKTIYLTIDPVLWFGVKTQMAEKSLTERICKPGNYIYNRVIFEDMDTGKILETIRI